jgi:hypothetical protein
VWPATVSITVISNYFRREKQRLTVRGFPPSSWFAIPDSTLFLTITRPFPVFLVFFYFLTVPSRFICCFTHVLQKEEFLMMHDSTPESEPWFYAKLKKLHCSPLFFTNMLIDSKKKAV